MAPPALERLVQTCFKKDPEERLQSARDVKLHLEWIGEAGSRAGTPAPLATRRKTRQRLAWTLVGACGILAAGFAFAYFREASVRPRPVRSYVLPPEKTSFAFDAATGGPVLSPDGTRMIFAAVDASGKKILWVRPLDSLTAQPLEGTEEASFPFWSPDSRFVGFFVPGKLKKIDTNGGPPQTVCPAANGRGGSWSAKGVMVFAPEIYGGLQRVPSAGGTPTALTELDKSHQQTSHRWPVFLPDGDHFLCWAGNPTSTTQEANGVYLGSLEEKEMRFLVQADSDGLYCPQGYLLFLRDRSLMAQPFDAGGCKTTGEAFPVAEEVANPQSFRRGCFSASRDGSLVYQTGENGRMQAVWLNSTGGDAGTVGDLAFIMAIRLSPDGQRVAEAVQEGQTKNVDLWLLDLARGVKTRFTFDPSPDMNPVWSPDGSRVAFSSNQKTHFDIYAKSATGSGDKEPLLISDADKYTTDWSRDGRYIAYTQLDSRGKTQADIFVLPLAGERKPYAFLQTEFAEGNAVFSPDGHWMAYQSNESGKGEVYVTSFPKAGGKWQVSQGGGAVPRWRHDGAGLYYRMPDGKLMEASIASKGTALEVGTPFQVSKIQLGEFGPNQWVVEPSPKDDRFLVLRPEKTASTPLTLVTHWPEGIKR
jgi:Tol biopolymer transport system component